MQLNTSVTDDLQQLAFHYRDRIIAEHDIRELASMNRTRLSRALETIVQQMLAEERRILGKNEQASLVDLLRNEVVGFGPLEPLLAREDVTEIMVVGPDEVYIEVGGRIQRVPIQFRDELHVRHIVDRIISTIGRRLDDSCPMVDARLPDGSRVNAVIPPIAVTGTALTIRKFSAKPLGLQDLLNLGALPPGAGRFLAAAIRSKLNILISGGTGSGKTTLLGAVAAMIPDGERLVIVEDMTEIRLNRPHVISLECRPTNTEGKGEVTIRQLVRNALRMRPDRIIVGEVRGAESFDMLQAMNSGHEGSLTTIHANSPQDALTRLEAMVIMATSQMPVQIIREHLITALDLIVQTERLPDGQRKVVSIAELGGRSGLQELYRFTRTGRDAKGTVQGHFETIDGLPECWERLEAYGQAPAPASLREGCM